MRRIALRVSCIFLLMAGTCCAQSLADAARANRAQKGAAPAKVITGDDLSEPVAQEVIHLMPGTSATGQGTLVAPGRGKHNYQVILLDASRFMSGGTIHITITLGNGESEGSFDLFPQGLRLPSDGFPRPLASTVNVPDGADGKIFYRFSRGTVFQFAAEGSWNAKAGATNTYTFVVDVGN